VGIDQGFLCCVSHVQELLPLIMCAIERHPDSSVRDSLTHLLFNLIKRPDELQRRIIMDVSVASPIVFDGILGFLALSFAIG